jgi:hypothetical protein
MLIAVSINKKRIEGYEYFAGVIISLGMVAFARADFEVLPNANLFGDMLEA